MTVDTPEGPAADKPPAPPAPPPRTELDESTLDTFARTIWGEARGEGYAGMCGVACVIVNRAARPGWWGHDIPSVCRQPYQFSCWLAGDPNRDKLLAVTTADVQFQTARGIAMLAMRGRLSDGTGGADSYYAEGSKTPQWAIGKTPTATIGHHRFFKLRG